MSLDYLDEISGGDNEFKKDLIKIFLRQMPEFISNMKKFTIEKDLKNLAKEAHTAKSSVLIFGMDEAGDTLKKIQNLAEKNDTGIIPKLIQNVETDLESISNSLLKITTV